MSLSDDVSHLLQSARGGDESALPRVLELYRNYLRLLAELQLGRQLQSKVSPSDVVQDACLAAIQGFDQFRGQTEAELLAWLRQILASQLAALARRFSTQKRLLQLERRLQADHDASSRALQADLAAAGSSPSEQAIKREQAVLLADALAQLSEDYRQVIIARHIHGRPFAEVAEEMNRTEAAVKHLWTRAIARLRDVLEADV
jgi:RNA polymerase sigma-70 factor, ECF subfamily